MEVLHESGKASSGREKSYLLSESYELQANGSPEARFTCSFGPITVSARVHACFRHAYSILTTFCPARGLYHPSVLLAL